MKLVNFEAGERVDAPDANALSDVVQGELTRIMSHLTMAESFFDVLGESPISFPDLGVSSKLIPDPWASISFGYDYPITTNPASSQPYIITVGISPSGVVKGGMFIGDSVENPSVNLGDLANETVGTVAFLYGRVKYKAGESRNRARWRSDLNPPREEVYLAKTRRIPAFDAIVKLQSEVPPEHTDGWFKIAKITRTNATTNDLRRFRFEDQRLMLLEGGYVSQRQNNLKETDERLTNINRELGYTLGQYGNSGIIQTIGSDDIVIADGWNRVDILPSKNEQQKQTDLTNLFQSYATSLSNSALLGDAGQVAYIYDKVKRETVLGLGTNTGLPLIENVGAFYLELQRILNQLQYGQDSYVGLDTADLAQDNTPSKRGYGWRTNHTLSSLASATNLWVVGFTLDSASNESFPEQLFKVPATVPTSMLMLLHIFKPMLREEGKISAHQGIVWTGHRAGTQMTLRDRDFGGTANDKANTTLRQNGGLIVKGGNLSGDNPIRSIESLLYNTTSELNSSPTNINRTLYANNAVLRRYGQGTAFAWCEGGTNGNKATLEINDLVITDLMPSFSLDEFFTNSSETGTININYLGNTPVLSEMTSINHQNGSLATISGGNITFKNCTFIMFHSTVSTVVGTHDEFPNGISTRGGVSIRLQSDRKSLNAPVRFEGCKFLRNSHSAEDGTSPHSIVSIYTDDGSDLMITNSMRERVIFDNCLFSDFNAYRETVSDTPVMNITNTGTSLVGIEENVSRYAKFKDCSFSHQSVFHEVIVDNCAIVASNNNNYNYLLSHRTRMGNPSSSDRTGLRVNFDEDKGGSTNGNRHISSADTILSQESFAMTNYLLPTGNKGSVDTTGKIVSMYATQREYDDQNRNDTNVNMLGSALADSRREASVLPHKSSYLNTDGQTDTVSVVMFNHRGDHQDDSSYLNMSDIGYSDVAIKAKSYTRFDRTLSPILSDRVKLNGGNASETATAELYHTEPSGVNASSSEQFSNKSNGFILHGGRIPFTMSGNEERFPTNPINNTNSANLFLGYAKRGFSVERPRAQAGFAEANKSNYHPWTGDSYGTAGRPTAFDVSNDIYKSTYSESGSQNAFNFRPYAFDGAVLQASSVLLSTPQEQSVDPLSHKLAGVNKLNSDAMTISGCLLITGTSTSATHIRCTYGNGDMEYVSRRDQRPVESEVYDGQARDGQLSSTFVSTNMKEFETKRLVGIVLFSESYSETDESQYLSPFIATSLGKGLLLYRGGGKSLYKAMAGASAVGLDLIGEQFYEAWSSCSLPSFSHATSTQTNRCVSIKLDLVPVESVEQAGFVYLILATKVLTDGSVASGFITDNARGAYADSLYSDSPNGFDLTDPDTLGSNSFQGSMGIEFHVGIRRKF